MRNGGALGRFCEQNSSNQYGENELQHCQANSGGSGQRSKGKCFNLRRLAFQQVAQVCGSHRPYVFDRGPDQGPCCYVGGRRWNTDSAAFDFGGRHLDSLEHRLREQCDRNNQHYKKSQDAKYRSQRSAAGDEIPQLSVGREGGDCDDDAPGDQGKEGPQNIEASGSQESEESYVDRDLDGATYIFLVV